MEEQYDFEPDSVHLSLNAGEIIIDRKNLEEFVTLVKDYLDKSRHEHAEHFANEFKGKPFINSFDQWQIGTWRLESRDGEMVLVRYPARSEIMYFFVAHFKRTDERWFVSSFDVLRMKEAR